MQDNFNITSAIQHVTFSSRGGAGTVARTLVEAQRRIGLDANLRNLTEEDLVKDWWRFPQVALTAGVDNFILKKAESPSLFSSFRSLQNQINIDELSAKILNLHWIEGAISRERLSFEMQRNPNMKVFWTLHDMRPFTAGCHQSGNCSRYEIGCNFCPMTRTIFQRLPAKLQSRYVKDYSLTAIHFIAPSELIARKALRSAALGNSKVTAIYNPISAEYFQIAVMPKKRSDSFCFIAKDITDPIKGFSDVYTFFSRNRNLKLMVVGRGFEQYNKTSNIVFCGELQQEAIRDLLSTCSWLIVNSSGEAAPLVAAEAASQGVRPIFPKKLAEALSPEIRENSILFENLAELGQLELRNDYQSEALVEKLMLSALSHEPSKIAKKYKEIYEIS